MFPFLQSDLYTWWSQPTSFSFVLHHSHIYCLHECFSILHVLSHSEHSILLIISSWSLTIHPAYFIFIPVVITSALFFTQMLLRVVCLVLCKPLCYSLLHFFVTLPLSSTAFFTTRLFFSSEFLFQYMKSYSPQIPNSDF